MSWHTPSIPKSGPSPSFSFSWQPLKCHHTLTMTRLQDEQNKNSSEPLLTNGMGLDGAPVPYFPIEGETP